jgi:Cupredoxin-like domain
MTLGQTLALVTLAAAVVGAGCKDKPSGGGAVVVGPLPAGAVQVTADDNGFAPSSVTFKKGAPASLVFVRTTDETCATEVVFPELDVKKDLPKGKPVTIEIPTDKEQKLTFQCGMAMYKSSVVINGN